MAESQRARKVSDRIRVVVAEMLEQKIKDPRLGFVTITDVRITGDLQNASRAPRGSSVLPSARRLA
jgi:ribosome-binding factor A